MSFRNAHDSVVWLVPSAAIAFAAFVFMNGDAPPDPKQTVVKSSVSEVAAVLPAPVLEVVDVEDEVVARQATPETSLTTVALQTDVVAAAPAPVRAPEPEPEPEPVREASLKPAAIDVPVFEAIRFKPAADANCVDDLRAMAAMAQVYFPGGGLTADPAGIEQGRLLGLIAQTCPGVKIRVNGHSDESGDSASNLLLSERRAVEVIEKIAASGVDAGVFFARAAGAQEPSGRTGPQPDGYYDRRVDFSIVAPTPTVTIRTAAAAPATCVQDLRRATEDTVLVYEPRSVSLSQHDLETALALAEMAARCPQARLRVIGQHASGLHTGEDVSTGRARANMLMAMMVGRGIASEEIIISAPSVATDESDSSGFPGSRVDFDVFVEES